MNALLDEFENSGFLNKYKTDEDGKVTHLFFAASRCIELAKENFKVVLIDSTYKTNRYRMPLLHVVGLTSTMKTFSLAFCFMKNETESDYCWALAVLRSCFDTDSTPRVIVTDRELALMKAILTL